MENECVRQLPHATYGVAYEDAMRGISVDLCLEDECGTIPRELLDRHTDSELVCIVPASDVPLTLCLSAPKLFEALRWIYAHFEHRPGLAERLDLLTADERRYIKAVISLADCSQSD